MTQVLTASATRDGQPLYRAANGAWTPKVEAAQLLASKSEAEEQLAVARTEEGQVCDPYLIDVSAEDQKVVPLSFRERIRATGPTIKLHRSA